MSISIMKLTINHFYKIINLTIILKENTMDVLSDILDTLKFKGSFYFSTNFTAPWGVQVPSYKNVARFHLVLGAYKYQVIRMWPAFTWLSLEIFG